MTLQTSSCSLCVPGARYNIEVCRLYLKVPDRGSYVDRFVSFPDCVGERLLPLLLSISETVTGDGGENDFGFCRDALPATSRACLISMCHTRLKASAT